LKVGVQIVHEAMAYEEILQIAKRCEQLGFDCVWIGDHFWWTSPTKPMLECWTLLTALASKTEKIRVGSLVLNNLLRNPALVASMANSLNEISKGRLNLGVGAGWHKKEAEMYNFEFPDIGERIDLLFRNLTYLKTLLHKGIPIWVGGFGDHILKKVVAKLADASNFERFDLTPEKCKEKIEYLNYHCRGRKLLEKSICLTIASEDVKERKVPLRNYLTGDYLKMAFHSPSTTVGFIKRRLGWKSATTIIGDSGYMIERLKDYSNAGITYFIVRYVDDKNLEKLANDVYPEVRKW